MVLRKNNYKSDFSEACYTIPFSLEKAKMVSNPCDVSIHFYRYGMVRYGIGMVLYGMVRYIMVLF